jgi:hypothetical protein
MKLYAAASGGAQEKGRQNRMKLSLPPTPPPPPPLFLKLMYFLCKFFFEFHPILDQIQGSGAVFSWLYGKL